MDEVKNMPLLDENKNSPIPEPHKPEKKELSLSSPTTDSENIAPQIILQNPTSPKTNNSEVNSNPSIQTMNNLNALSPGIPKPDSASAHDTSNGSFVGDAGVSFKSCNDSFIGDVNNSFKSLDGSYVIASNSPKNLPEIPPKETTQSAVLQRNANLSHDNSEENANFVLSSESTGSDVVARDASFNKDQQINSVKSILDTTFESLLPNCTDYRQTIISSTNSMSKDILDLQSNQTFSFDDSNMSNDPSVPTQQHIDPSNVFEDSGLDGALAAFSSLKLNDSVAHPLPSHETSQDDTKDIADTSNLMGFTTMIQDTSISGEGNSQMPIQVDPPATDDNINKNIDSHTLKETIIAENKSPLTSEKVPEDLAGAPSNDCLNSKYTKADPSESMPSVSAVDVCDRSLASKDAKPEASPLKTALSENLPTAPSDGACTESLDLKKVEASPLKIIPPGNVPDGSGDGTFKESFSFKDVETSSVKITPSENMPNVPVDDVCIEPFYLNNEKAQASPLMTAMLQNLPSALSVGVCSESCDSKSFKASPLKVPSSGSTLNAMGDGICNEPFYLNNTQAQVTPSKTEPSGNMTSASGDGVCMESFGLKNADESPFKMESLGNTPNAAGNGISSGARNMKDIEPEVSPMKIGRSENVPDSALNVVCSEPTDFKGMKTEGTPPKHELSENAHVVSIDASCNQHFEVANTKDMTKPPGKISEDLDVAMGKDPFDLAGGAVPASPFKDETFGGPLCDDPFNLKGFETKLNPCEDFVFKVPEAPIDVENEEFTDAVQFFKDPSSFQFLENIKTSPTMEDNLPRSSLYIKFDPLHSFPKNPSSSDVLQALKNENLDVNMLNLPARESLGNILISFDSPRKSTGQSSAAPVIVAPAKVYTEEELQQLLSVNELTNQEILLKKQREMEEELARKEKELMARVVEKDTKIALLENCIRSQKIIIGELTDVSMNLVDKQKDKLKRTEALEEENAKLKGDVKTLTEDLQSVETTFADFHKRYEQCKGMLKTYKENEELLKTQLKEQQHAYQVLQDGSRETLEKANSEVASVKKTSEAQTAVLKAQLKKAEMRISSLESDIKQIKIENSQLGGICDDLMEKVGKS